MRQVGIEQCQGMDAMMATKIADLMKNAKRFVFIKY